MCSTVLLGQIQRRFLSGTISSHRSQLAGCHHVWRDVILPVEAPHFSFTSWGGALARDGTVLAAATGIVASRAPSREPQHAVCKQEWRRQEKGAGGGRHLKCGRIPNVVRFFHSTLVAIHENLADARKFSVVDEDEDAASQLRQAAAVPVLASRSITQQRQQILDHRTRVFHSSERLRHDGLCGQGSRRRTAMLATPSNDGKINYEQRRCQGSYQLINWHFCQYYDLLFTRLN